MNILIIVKYFPPEAGGGRSYRMSKLTKYLTNSGNKVTVLSSSEKIDSDNTILNELNRDLFNDVRIEYKPGGIIRFLTKIFKQISVADGDVVFVYELIDKLMKTQINMVPDVVFTSSAPYEVHFIGMYLQKKYGIKWVADFRDPYTLNHNYKSMLPIKGYFDRKYERGIYNRADGVIFNTHINRDESCARFSLDRNNVKYTVCQNGYDEDDVACLHNVNTNKTILSYVGGIRGDRQERYFIDQVVMNETLLDEHNILVRFIGNGSQCFVEQAKEHSSILQIIGFCEQDNLKKYWNETDWLILFLPESDKMLGWVPQKVYTYMSVKKPVLAIIPDGEAKNYLKIQPRNIFIEPNNYKLSDIIPSLVKVERVNDNDDAKEFEQKELFGKLERWIKNEIIDA